MRSLLLSLVLGLGALGLSLGAPTQARAGDFRSPAIYSGTTTPVAYYWRRGFYPGWGYRSYYPFGNGFYRNYGYRSYYPGFYSGYRPWGWGGYYAPYGGFYYRRGLWW
jgi:hypothetical protein